MVSAKQFVDGHSRDWNCPINGWPSRADASSTDFDPVSNNGFRRISNIAKREELTLKRIPMFCLVFLFFSTIHSEGQTLSPQATDHPTYRYAYYLFLVGPQAGCEGCYVPLLITAEPLEQVAKAKGNEACVLIVTYERDSIWHDDGIVSVASNDIEVVPRIIDLRDLKYRYQEISTSEVLKLLKNPMGTVPISRPFLPRASSPGPTLEKLISDFQNTN